MSKIARAMQQAASGAGDDPIHKLFSIDAWWGNQSSQTINNGINLSGRGGLVMITPYKDDGTANMMNSFYDTVRGDNKVFKFGAGKWTGSGISDFNTYAYSGTDGTSVTLANSLSFTSSGYTIGSATNPNYFDKPYHAYTFRIAPRFFDIVSWTGNGSASARTLTLKLKIKPGMIWGLNLTDATNIYCYHHFGSHTYTNSARLQGSHDGNYIGTIRADGNSTNWAQSDAFGGESPWTSTANAPTATEFKVGPSLNTSGKEYIAYLWAHDVDTSGGNRPKIQAVHWANPITAGYNYHAAHPSSPQVTTSYGRAGMFTWSNMFSDGHFMVIDQMSGMNEEQYSDGLDYSKSWSMWTTRNYGHHHSINYVNRSNNRMKLGGTTIGHMGKTQNNHYNVGMVVVDPTWSEKPSSPSEVFTVGGFGSNSGGWNTTHKVNTALITSGTYPTAGTQPNHLALMSSNTSGKNFRMNYGSAHSSNWFTDITSGNENKPGFYNTGVLPTATSTTDLSSKYALGFWKESFGYHSVDMYQTHTGSGVNNAAYISLGTVPEFMIIQSTVNAGTYPKIVYHKYINATDADKNDYYLEANNSKPAQNATDYWGSSAWGASNATSLSQSYIYLNGSYDHIWKPGDGTATMYTYLVWAWGSKPGFSKFGAYTGNGNATGPSIDCGFSAGARCVMIKNVSEHQAWLWINPYGGADTVDYQVKVGYNANNESSSSGTLADNQDIQYISNEDVVDKTSNGFQVKGTNPNRNKSGDRYIYCAWA